MNWWLAGSWFVACVLIGLGVYRQARCRVRDYAEWVGFCNHVQQAIGFAMQPLPQVVAEYLPVCHGGCHSALQQYEQWLVGKVDFTRTDCARLVADQNLAEFLYQLGRTGRETEQEKTQALRGVLQNSVDQAQQYLRGKASIELKLLIIIGIAGGI